VLTFAFVLLFIFVGDTFWDWIAATLRPAHIVNASHTRLESENAFQIGTAIVRNFQSPYASLEAFLSEYNYHEHGLRWGIDYIWALLAMLPEKILGISTPPTIANMNTYFVQGQVRSIVPPGLVVFAMYSLALPGLVLFCTGFGVGGGVLNGLARRRWGVWWVKVFYALISIRLVRFVQYGEPKVFFTVNLDMFLILFLLIYWNYVIIFFRWRGRRPAKFETPWWR
jgi:hypothetical protein